MTLRVLLPHPPTNAKELHALLQLVNHLSSRGGIVILGQNRCFICGTELGAPVPDSPLKRVGGGPTKVFMRLCEQCFERVKP
jgi:hypothetical protein